MLLTGVFPEIVKNIILADIVLQGLYDLGLKYKKPKKNTAAKHFITLAVFGENPRYCYSLGVAVVVIMQKLLHFVISLL